MADFDPHVDVPRRLGDLLTSMSTCRSEGCFVPRRHPSYLDERGPALKCGPVVSTRVNLGGVMILGAYPNTRYRTRNGDQFVPAGDIDEPFENTRYFDGSGIRAHLSGELLEEAYLRPLGLDRSGVYVSNVVKCFLFRDYDVKSYARHGFPGAEQLSASRGDYLTVAMHCHRLWLARELRIAKPRLVIALGGEVRQIIHANDGVPGQNSGIWDVGGVLMPAGKRGHDSDTRDEKGPFFDLNIVHLYHPGALLRDRDEKILRRHEEEHLPSVGRILRELGLEPKITPKVRDMRARLVELRAQMANDTEV